LTSGIEALALDALSPGEASVRWFEVVPQPERPLPPAARRVVDAWNARGASVDVQCVAGPQFWDTQEITDCPDLIAKTTAAMTAAGAGERCALA
jgi:hypothetical protein